MTSPILQMAELGHRAITKYGSLDLNQICVTPESMFVTTHAASHARCFTYSITNPHNDVTK